MLSPYTQLKSVRPVVYTMTTKPKITSATSAIFCHAFVETAR